jgi:hypothetical protein
MALLITIRRLKKKRMTLQDVPKKIESKDQSEKTLLDYSFEEIKRKLFKLSGIQQTFPSLMAESIVKRHGFFI